MRISGAGARAAGVVAPREAMEAFRAGLFRLARGEAVVVDGLGDELTPVQAARLLGMPRAALAAHLRSGALPARREGTRFRVRLDDLVAFERQLAARHDEALAQLAEEAHALDLGYPTA